MARRQSSSGRWGARRAPLPEDFSFIDLRDFERMSRAECARRLGISRQAVQQAEISGLEKIAAQREAFRGYL